MQTQMPFFETPEDALKYSIQSLGGAKAVAPSMWPDKSVENARDYLLACLNSDRAEKLSYSQIIYIFKLAKQIGAHAGFEWFANACEYESNPISLEEQKERATQVLAHAADQLERALNTLNKLSNQR
jgi:hypothetical protein